MNSRMLMFCLTITSISQVTDPIFQIQNPDTRPFGVGVGVCACVYVGLSIFVVVVMCWNGPKWDESRLADKVNPAETLA